MEELRTRKYDPDPVRVWKKQQKNNAEEEQEQEPEEGEAAVKIGDYDYLLDMPMRSLTYEKKEELLRKRDVKMQEYDILLKKSPADLWREDLDALMKMMVELEEAEKEEAKEQKKSAKAPVAAKGRKKLLPAVEVLPSPKGEGFFKFRGNKNIYYYFFFVTHLIGRRIVPVIDPELRKKVEKAQVAKEKKKERALKKESPAAEVEKDSFDAVLDDSNNKSLSDKLGISPLAKGAKAKKGGKKADGLKQTKLNFTSKKTADKDEFDDLDEFDKALGEAIPLRCVKCSSAFYFLVLHLFSSQRENGSTTRCCRRCQIRRF